MPLTAAAFVKNPTIAERCVHGGLGAYFHTLAKLAAPVYFHAANEDVSTHGSFFVKLSLTSVNWCMHQS